MFEAVEYFFTPSTHNCVLARVPVTVAVASISTGEPTVASLIGAQILTPSDVGAAQPEVPHAVGTTTREVGGECYRASPLYP